MKLASTRLPIGFVVFALSSVVNPAYLAGCFGEEEPDFGEKELLQSLDSANDKGTWTFRSGGDKYKLDLSLIQRKGEDAYSRAPAVAPLFARAHACGSRTFAQSASACVTETSLALEGTLTLRRIDDAGNSTELLSDVEVIGELSTTGSTFESASLTLRFVDQGVGGSAVYLHSPDARKYNLHTFRTPDTGDDKIDVSFQVGDQ